MFATFSLGDRGTGPLPYAASFRNQRFACGWYGVGHTTRRHPGEMRGTVIGKRGRFREGVATRGGDD
jgi:hypothetical protein